MRVLKFLILLFIFIAVSAVDGYVMVIHPNTMNITNSSGAYNTDPNIIAYKVNDTITFEALAPNSVAEDILENGLVKWDFGDSTETDYGSYRTTTHKYSFPFPYPVAWCGYLNNTGYSKALTYNWLFVGNVANTIYIFNGSPSNSKTQWDIYYNKTNGTVIIKYYSANITNIDFNGLSVDTTPITVNVSRDEIVKGDTVRFNFSINRNIILCVWSFGDGTFSFEKSPEHTYTKAGFYYPRVLVIDDSGNVMVGYLDKGIKVKRPRGGYIYWVTGPSHYDGEAYTYVYNSSGGHNNNKGNAYTDPYKITYKVDDNTIFHMTGAWGYYWKWDFGDGTETSYHVGRFDGYHQYRFPFMWPFFWMSYGSGSWWKSDTLNFIIVDDVGNTRYNFYPSSSHDKTSYDYEYIRENHTVNLYYYSDVISTPKLNVKLKDGYYIDITATAEPTEVNVYEDVKFDCSPYGNPIFIMWCFGDGTCSFEKSPIHRYSSSGLYYPHVFIIDENGNIEVGIPSPIGVGGYSSYPQIYASPTIAPTNYPINITIMEPVWWAQREHHIYFGDGNDIRIKPRKSPYTFTHTYISEGVYPIDMKVYTAENMKTVYIIDNKDPIAKLYIYPNPASYKDTISFNPMNSHDPDNGRDIPEYNYYHTIIGHYTIPPNSPMAKIYGFNLTVYDSNGNVVWNYTSNELKIVYNKFSPGNYTAKLVVWDGMGGVNSTTATFSVINRPPVAQFTYYPHNPKPNENVSFISQSYDPDGNIVKYIWNFGDGTVINTTNNTVVYHNYTYPGYYTVTLTVFDNYNISNSTLKQVVVSGILANFTYEIIGNYTVRFKDTSIVIPGKIVEWNWNFGDGSTSTEQNPTHTYDKGGVYFVTLTIKSNTNLTDSKTKVVILSPIPKYPPVAEFTYKIINDTVVEFDASSSHDPDGNIVKYIWNFGDGNVTNTTKQIIRHTYPKYGIYPVTLTVVDNDNLSDSKTKLIDITKVSIHDVPVPLYVKLLIIISTLFCFFQIVRGLK